MSPTRHPTVDKKVPPNWKPVAGLEQCNAGMHWSDRVWYWLVSLGGLALAPASRSSPTSGGPGGAASSSA